MRYILFEKAFFFFSSILSISNISFFFFLADFFLSFQKLSCALSPDRDWGPKDLILQHEWNLARRRRIEQDEEDQNERKSENQGLEAVVDGNRKWEEVGEEEGEVRMNSKTELTRL